VGAVLVGGVKEVQALIVAGPEQVGEAVDAELAGLVRRPAHAVGAGAHGQAAEHDFFGPSAMRSLASFCVGLANRGYGK
jgi:hypothetical protein